MFTGSFRGFSVDRLDDAIVGVTLRRPKRKNGLTHDMKRDLLEVLNQIQVDPDIAVVVFQGEGESFCAGDDITGKLPEYDESAGLAPQIQHRGDDAEGTFARLRTWSQPLTKAVRGLDKLTIAAVQGHVIQSGLSLALACDLRIAGSSLQMGSATLRFGFLPDEGGHALLVQYLGAPKALQFLLSKSIVDAEEAMRLGLVTEVVDDEDLAARTLAVARERADLPRFAARMTKHATYAAADLSFDAALDDIALRTVPTDHVPDAKEGRRAFVEKRPAQFGSRKVGS